MGRYMLFGADNAYEQGGLESHLYYLKRWGGTPDMFDSVGTLPEAIDDARRENFRVAIVDERDDYEVVCVIENAEEES